MFRVTHVTLALLASLGLLFSGPHLCPADSADQQDKLLADDDDAGDFFGDAVSIDGDYAAVGACRDDEGGDDAGAAYVFLRVVDDWSQQAKLLASDAAADDGFGFSVAIDGDRVVVGAPFADHSEQSRCGAAYVFEHTGTSWSQTHKLTASDADDGDFFGFAVDIDGDYIVVGAWGNEAAYVFHWNALTSNWDQQAKLTVSFAESRDHFGEAVSIDGKNVAIGAPEDDDNGNFSGSAYVFGRSGTSWSEQDKLTADDGAAGDWFGISVSISGDTVLIGAHLADGDGTESTGAAYTFRLDLLGHWVQEQKLTADDAASWDFFGFSVSLSGDYCVIGAPLDDDNGSMSGSGYLFCRNGTWSQEDKFTPSDGAPPDSFGRSIWITGEDICVGAPHNSDGGTDSGSAYVFIVVSP